MRTPLVLLSSATGESHLRNLGLGRLQIGRGVGLLGRLPDGKREDTLMKALLLAVACVIMITGPALACRGTSEFPQALKQLEQSNVSSERLNELRQQLTVGQSLHEEGHRLGDGSKMVEALRILDGITAEIGQ